MPLPGPYDNKKIYALPAAALAIDSDRKDCGCRELARTGAMCGGLRNAVCVNLEQWGGNSDRGGFRARKGTQRIGNVRCVERNPGSPS